MQFEQRDLEILSVPDDTIRKKEYLGNRGMRHVVVPPYVKNVEAWAFSHCKNLKTIWLPKQLKKIEAKVFDGCNGLQRIYVYENNSTEFDISKVYYYETEAALLAFGARYFLDDIPDGKLFDFSHIAEPVWYQWYDDRLRAYIEEPDEKGFMPFLAGGEEDYEDPDNNMETYCSRRQQEKIDGILKRLWAGEGIRHQETFISYIKNHQEATIKLLVKMREQSITGLSLLSRYNILTEDNIDLYLSSFEGSLFTECRAYLLHEKEKLLENKKDGIWNRFEI